MAWRFRPTTEFAFVASAIAVASLGWIADFFGALAGATEEGHGSLLYRLNILFFALGLAGIGVVADRIGRLLRDEALAMKYLAGYLILADGFIHAFAFNDHLREPFQAAFFAVIAPLQIVVGLALPYLGRPRSAAWLGLTAFLVSAWAVTRTVSLEPLVELEAVESLDLLSKGAEILAAVALIRLIRLDRPGRPRPGVRSSDASTSDG